MVVDASLHSLARCLLHASFRLQPCCDDRLSVSLTVPHCVPCALSSLPYVQAEAERREAERRAKAKRAKKAAGGGGAGKGAAKANWREQLDDLAGAEADEQEEEEADQVGGHCGWGGVGAE